MHGTTRAAELGDLESLNVLDGSRGRDGVWGTGRVRDAAAWKMQ